MRIRTLFGLLLVAITLASSLSVPNALAQGGPNPPGGSDQERAQVRDRALGLVQKYRGDIASLDKALAAEGWQKATVVSVENTLTVNGVPVNVDNTAAQSPDGTGVVQPLSTNGCGQVTPKNAYRQSNGSELVVGNFAYTCSTYDSPTRPQDAISLHAADSAGNSLNVPATNASGWVEDTAGARRDSYIWPSTISGSSVGYTLDDQYVSNQWVGKKGGVSFFLNSRPTNAGGHYLKMCWQHNWANNNINISSIKLSYPWDVSVTFDTSGSVQQWRQCQQMQITYPNG